MVIFRRFKVPDVLILMLFGMAIGPIAGLVQPSMLGKAGPILTTVALVIILFESGASMSLRSLVQAGKTCIIPTFLTSGLTIAVTAAFFLILKNYFNFELIDALILGAIISGTSSAVVIPMVNSLQMKSSLGGALILESAITDVLCIVLMVAFLQTALAGSEIQTLIVARDVIINFASASFIGILGGVLWIRSWIWMAALKQSFFTTVAVVLIIYGLAEYLGVSGAIASLVFGLTLNNQNIIPNRFLFLSPTVERPNLNESERSLYSELVFLLKTFFFVYLGMSMPLHDLSPHWIAFGLLAFIYASRYAVIFFFSPKDADRREKRISAVMIPKGLAAAVLAGVPAQKGLESGLWIESISYAVVFQSIVITSILIYVIESTSLKPVPEKARA